MTNIQHEIQMNRLSSLRGLVMLFGCLILLLAVFNTALNVYRVVQLDQINKRLQDRVNTLAAAPKILSARCGEIDADYPANIAEESDHAE